MKISGSAIVLCVSAPGDAAGGVTGPWMTRLGEKEDPNHRNYIKPGEINKGARKSLV